MVKTKPPKPSNNTTKSQNDIDAVKSDVASFVSSLGFASSLPSSGFNDADFRKTGRMKQNNAKPHSIKPEKPTNKTPIKPKLAPKPTPKTPPLTLKGDGGRGFEKFKDLPRLPLVKASGLGVWYMDAMEMEKKVLGGESKLEVTMGVQEWKRVVQKKRELGERLLWQYGKEYEESRGQSGDIKMLVATQRSGTAADKVSAFSVLVGDNPLANLRPLDALLGMVMSKVGKRHALTGFEALKELFISSLLPDRKLKTLLQRPVNKIPETKDGYSLLLFWYWEECVKQRYERFVSALEDASRDMLPVLKDKALKTMFVLLKSKSELERRLLSALVNKLGDPQNKSASNADFHLSNLLSEHPNMKAVVIDEVDTFLFRPHLGLRAKYHAVNFLSQIRLSHKGDGPKVAKRLIDVYFALFKVLITEAGSSQKTDEGKAGRKKTPVASKENEEEGSSESHVELDSRLLSALLTGVNRAFPYVSSAEADDIIEVHTPMLFQLVHSKNFNVGIQALMLLDKISSKNHIVSDRFYRALYSKLLLPSAMNSSKAEMFIGLLLRAMKNDVNLKRVAAFSKRLLQVALQQPPQYACGCLFLLSEVLKARPPLWNMVLQNESIDDDLEHFEDIVEENDDKRPTASKKEERAYETPQSDHKAESENESSEDKSNSCSSEDEEDDEDDSPASGSDDDSDEDDDLDEADQILIKEDLKEEAQESQSLYNNRRSQPEVSSTTSSLPGGYNPRHREPSYCNADRTSWWELLVLASHAHPSVATMAGTLLSGANIVYNGNPLNDLTLAAFLDKFMEKKPKQTTWHGGSQIEPAKKLDMNNHMIGPEILSLAEMDVPPEDLVFHKFYLNKMNTSKTKKKKKKKGAEEETAEDLFDVHGDEAVGGDDESDNEEIDNLLDSTNMSFEADGEYDYDDLDQVANEDDDDLVGDVSDIEMDALSDVDEEEDFGAMGENDAENDHDDDDGYVGIGNADDGNEDERVLDKRKRKQKSGGKAGASPFASLEDYEHLLNEETPTDDNSNKKKNRLKSEKRRKSSK